MNSSISKKYKKVDVFIIVLFLVCLLVVGGTYAYIILPVTVTNGNYNAATTCFSIDYSATNDNGTLPITGVLFPSSGPSGGLFGKVAMKVNSSCKVNGKGTVTLNVTTGSDKLFQTVGGHCENSKTLKTMVNYTTSSNCAAQTNGLWVTDGNALKYAIYNTNSISSSTVPLKVGYVNKTGSIVLYNNFDITSTQVNYYIYIWLDGNISDNSYANLSFNGYISASANQIS